MKSFAAPRHISETLTMPRSLLLILLFALHLVTAPTIRAQELDPLLAPHAEQYNAGIEALRRTRKTQLSVHETTYAQKLDAAISAAKDEAMIKILRKEREGLVKGMLAPANPASFPEEVTSARKSFFNGAGKVSVDYNAAKKKVDDEYLKTLAGLAKQAKSKSSPPGLAAQVAAEKRRVTSGN